MATDMEKARVTELYVRMDCNGCVQRIKKALHSIDGVYNVSVDFPLQKLTVVGPADPEMLVKAIKKTRKTATICSRTEPGGPEPSVTEPPPPDADTTNQPESEAPPSEASPPTEFQNNGPSQESLPSTGGPEPSSEAQQPGSDVSKDVEEVHMVHDYPHNYTPINGHEIRQEAPYYVNYSYNTYRPMPNVSEYGYIRSNPQDVRYYDTESYSERYYHNRSSDGNQITSMFSDENPNACRIV